MNFWSGVSIALAGLALTAAPALACKCQQRSRDAAIASTPIVFEGRVLRVRKDGDKLFADVETGRILKGTVPRIVEVQTMAEPAACGFAFKAGQRLTVGAVFSQQQFSTTSCAMLPLNPGGT